MERLGRLRMEMEVGDWGRRGRIGEKEGRWRRAHEEPAEG